MKKYTLLETDYFEKKFKQIIPQNFHERFKEHIFQLQDRPFKIGKPLGVSFLRELKVDRYRLYYLIYEAEVIILLVTVSTKKFQQKTIDAIKENLQDFRSVVDETNNLNRKE